MILLRNYVLHYILYMLLWLVALPAAAGGVLLVRCFGIRALGLALALLLPEALITLARIALGGPLDLAGPSPRNAAAMPPHRF